MDVLNFFSKGKLLLTSEYFVLDGALALAVSTKVGQSLTVEKLNPNDNCIIWNAKHQDNLWLEVKLDLCTLKIISTNNEEATSFVQKLLNSILVLAPSFLGNFGSCFIETNLQFPANYGLGSSSTLINNIANWARVDAFQLNELALGGSGYDIAVAKENSSILYKNMPKREVEKVVFQPVFSDELLFIHLNQKQDSREGIKMYQAKEKNISLIEEFSSLTQKILQAKNIEEFSNDMEIHEQKLSSFLEIPTVKSQFFQDCPVFVKSLGAWGGDFVLSRKFPNYQQYFTSKGFTDIWDWADLVG